MVGSVAASHLDPAPGITTSNECDTNTYTCFLGKKIIILEYKQRAAGVYAYYNSLNPIEMVTIVNCTTACYDPI